MSTTSVSIAVINPSFTVMPLLPFKTSVAVTLQLEVIPNFTSTSSMLDIGLAVGLGVTRLVGEMEGAELGASVTRARGLGVGTTVRVLLMEGELVGEMDELLELGAVIELEMGLGEGVVVVFDMGLEVGSRLELGSCVKALLAEGRRVGKVE